MIEYIISTGILAFGIIVLVSNTRSWRNKRGYWINFRSAAAVLGLQVKEGPITDYGLPNLYGELDEREVYVHPTIRKKKRTTVFAVECNIPITEDILVLSPRTTRLETDVPQIKVPAVEDLGMEIRSVSEYNKKIADRLFSEKSSSMMANLVDMAGDDFRALIFEPGICMFSTFHIHSDKNDIISTLEYLVELVKELESHTDIKEMDNDRFRNLDSKSHALRIELSMMALFLITGIITMIFTFMDHSSVAFSLGVVLITIPTVRIYFLAETRGWIDKST